MDPGFLVSGFKFAKRGSIWAIYPTVLEIPHVNEIICAKKGGSSKPPNPSRASFNIVNLQFFKLEKMYKDRRKSGTQSYHSGGSRGGGEHGGGG